MHPDTLVPIRKYMRPIDAHIDRALLQDAGFEAFVANELTATAAPHLMYSGGTAIELQVRAADAEQAEQFLIEQAKAEPLDEFAEEFDDAVDPAESNLPPETPEA